MDGDGKGNWEDIIGIDLGTTNSCVGVWDPASGRAEIIPNAEGHRTTPSYVSYWGNDCLVGDLAKARQTTNSDNTLHNAKRIIGRCFSHIRQEDLDSWPFRVVATAEDKPRYSVTFKGEPKSVSPEEISALVLGKLKQSAEQYLGRKVTKAVITVPAYFTEPQKRATLDAGQLAGLEVQKLLTEPTAAALAYGLDKRAIGEGERAQKARVDGLYILVFDLGGGTFDVSVLKLDGRGSFITKAVTGDFHLGGEDFDERIVQDFVKKFTTENPEVSKLSKKSLRKIRAECESAKRMLSNTTETMVDMELQGVEFTYTLSRQHFEQLNEDLFGSVMIEVTSALELARVGRDEIDEVILVGGSTRIPAIQQRLSNYFNGRTLWTRINPDEAVAMGAALQAAALVKGDSQAAQKAAGLDKLTVTSVTPLPLGIELSDGRFDTLIGRATKLPTVRSQYYTTAIDNQSTVIIKVYEGNQHMASQNSLLGKFNLHVDPALAGAPKVEVRFEITIDGLFSVDAKEVNSDRKMRIEFEKYNLTEGEKRKIIEGNATQ